MKTSIAVKKRQASAHQGKVQPLTEAQNQLILDHIPYAKHVARKYAGDDCPAGITLMQLETESCSALCEAALRFDPTSDADFKTFAYDWCRKSILAFIRDWSCSDFEDIENVTDEVLEEDEDAQAAEREQKVKAMMAVLDQKERQVVRLLFGFDGKSKNFKQIAVVMHIQVARVHQIYEKARTKMEFSL